MSGYAALTRPIELSGISPADHEVGMDSSLANLARYVE